MGYDKRRGQDPTGLIDSIEAIRPLPVGNKSHSPPKRRKPQSWKRKIQSPATTVSQTCDQAD